jgi:DNA-binding GntR family transcriptional regulator
VPERRLPQLTSPTLADQAYDALREAIISGDLAPREKITERGLADRLAISPTPVREALRRLEQDRLIERLGPRAVQVTELDDGTAGEIRLVEGTLRALAARLAATNATDDQLARIERLLDEGDAALARLQAEKANGDPIVPTDLAAVLHLTREFHSALNEASNNLVLLRLLSLVDAFSLTQRLRKLDGELRDGDGAYEGVLHRYEEHRAIFDAVRRGDGARAEQMMLAHAATDALVDR